MKIFIGSFVFSVLSAGVVLAEDGSYYWNQNQTINSLSGYQNIIGENVTLTQASNSGISVTESMSIYNYGKIDGSLIVDDDYAVTINNTGEITGTVTASQVTQVINSESSMTAFDVDSPNFEVKVENVFSNSDYTQGINLTQLIALGANSFDITNSAIIIDDYSEWQNWDANVSLSQEGVIKLIINDSGNIESGNIINHVTNPGNVSIFLADVDEDLYTIQLVGQNEVTLNIIRETNYSNVTPLDDNVAGLLEEIQNSENGSALIDSLNAATNLDELQNIMNLSYRFNPSILMRPIRVISNFVLHDNLFNNLESGVGIKPFYITSDNTNSFGTKLYWNRKYKYFDLGVNVNFNHFDYENAFNDFSGNLYGADIKIKKQLNNIWLNGLVGGSVISFKTDSIIVDDDTKNNPYGYYVYGGIDGGYDYSIANDLIFTPLVGITYEKFYVLNFSDADINLRTGGNVKYMFTVDGIKYEYSVAGAVNNNSDLIGIAKIGFVSVADGVGITLGLDAITSKDYTAYKMSIDGKVIF